MTFFVRSQTPVVRDMLTVILINTPITLNHVDSRDLMVVDDHGAGSMKSVLGITSCYLGRSRMHTCDGECVVFGIEYHKQISTTYPGVASLL